MSDSKPNRGTKCTQFSRPAVVLKRRAILRQMTSTPDAGEISQVLKFNFMPPCVAGYANSIPTIWTVSELIKKASWQNEPSMPCLA